MYSVILPGKLATTAEKPHVYSVLILVFFLASVMIEESTFGFGMKQFLVLDRGDNTCLLIVIYNSVDEQEASAPIAAGVLGEYTQKFLSEAPERKQVKVLFNY